MQLLSPHKPVNSHSDQLILGPIVFACPWGVRNIHFISTQIGFRVAIGQVLHWAAITQTLWAKINCGDQLTCD